MTESESKPKFKYERNQPPGRVLSRLRRNSPQNQGSQQPQPLQRQQQPQQQGNLLANLGNFQAKRMNIQGQIAPRVDGVGDRIQLRLAKIKARAQSLGLGLGLQAQPQTQNAVGCPKCNAVLPEGSNFCGKCGYDFQAEEKEAVRRRDEMERFKLNTIENL